MNETPEDAFGQPPTEAGDAFGQPSEGDRRKIARRKQDIVDLELEINKRFSALTDRLARFISKALLGFVLLGISCAIGLAGFGIVLTREHTNAANIQSQREETIRRNCDEQNHRHNRSSDALIKGAAVDEAMRKTEADKKEVRRRRDVTLGLIDALAPLQDCDKLVEQGTGGKK